MHQHGGHRAEPPAHPAGKLHHSHRVRGQGLQQSQGGQNQEGCEDCLHGTGNRAYGLPDHFFHEIPLE